MTMIIMGGARGLLDVALVVAFLSVLLIVVQAQAQQEEGIKNGVNAIVGDCSAAKDAYANCVFRLDPPAMGKACDDCRIQSFEFLPTTGGGGGEQCMDIERTLCNAVHSCGCGDCEDELEAFWQCTSAVQQGCAGGIQCFTQPSESPTGPLCPKEFGDYRKCVFSLPEESDGTGINQRDECDSCRLKASASIPTTGTTCEQVQEIFCSAVRECNCGDCNVPLEQYLDCDVYKRWFGECHINCGIASAAVAQRGTEAGGANGAGQGSGAADTTTITTVSVQRILLLQSILVLGVLHLPLL